MNKYSWRRLTYYNIGLIVFFGFCMILYTVNQNLTTPILSQEIIGYFFWLSLGLILGFMICKHEMERVIFGKERNNK